MHFLAQQVNLVPESQVSIGRGLELVLCEHRRCFPESMFVILFHAFFYSLISFETMLSYLKSEFN